jgi:hypothetical protein
MTSTPLPAPSSRALSDGHRSSPRAGFRPGRGDVAIYGKLNSLDVQIDEQRLSAGAAFGNALTAAHVLGFGAQVLSGARCRDRHFETLLV